MYRRPHEVPASVYKPEHGSSNYELARGTVVLAARAGVVKNVGTTSLGTHIIVDHDGDLSTFYQHLERADVHKGQQVEQGQVMGIAGHGSIGPIRHLHFELRKSGTAFDPEPWLVTWPVIGAPGGGFILKLVLAAFVAWGALKVLK
jgi:murein DD-endopeptidase MepM/ murein hydrolase activator NlpD